MIKFDVFSVSHEMLLDTMSSPDSGSMALDGQTWRILICFDGDCAQDLSEVSDKLGITKDDIIRQILRAPLRLYMYGFAPGFAYLGGLDDKLNIARRDTPRAPMPKGSLMIAGGARQSVLYIHADGLVRPRADTLFDVFSICSNPGALCRRR